MNTESGDLTREEEADLLIQGIEAMGLDVDEELDRIDSLSAFESLMTIREFQLAGISARMDKLPGAGSGA